MTKRKKFGEILVEAGVIKEVALRQALERQKQTGRRLGKVLESMGIITEKDIAVALGHQYGYRTVKDLAKYSFPVEVLGLIEAEKAKKLQIFPLKRDGGSLLLAMVNPLDIQAIDEISAATRLRVVPLVTTPKEILEAVARHYGETEGATKAVAASGGDWWSVLVADPDRSSRTQHAALLKSVGYHVEQAADYAEALGLALQLSPHLIVIDIDHKESLDASELYRSLRGAIPMVALGGDDLAREVALLEQGFVDYLPKPVAQARLAVRVRRGLQLVYGDGRSAPQ